MTTLTLHLCRYPCTAGTEWPVQDVSACTCGAAERNRLIVETRKAARMLSHHNAAEGRDRDREAEARQRAHKNFTELATLCSSLGVDWRQGETGYLV